MRSIVIGFLVLIIMISVSCSNAVDNHEESGEQQIEVVTDNSTMLQENILEFHDLLKSEKYTECLNYLSPSFREKIGDASILEEMEHRNSLEGFVDQVQVIYVSESIQSENPLNYVYTRCYNQNAILFYEKIGVLIDGDSILIESFDFGKLPYLNVEMANNKEFELNIFLSEVYSCLNSDDLEKTLEIVDDTIKQIFSLDEIREEFNKKIFVKPFVKSFSVESLKVELKYGLPIIDMNVLETTEDGNYMSNLLLTDRNGEYFMVLYEDRTVEGSTNLDDLSSEESEKILGIIDDFYGDLRAQNYDVVMSKIDKAVFENNDFNNIKNSFVARNSYYGVPINNERTNYTIQDLDGQNLVHVFYTVSNAKNITSYENILILQSNTGEYSIFGYDFTDKPEN